MWNMLTMSNWRSILSKFSIFYVINIIFKIILTLWFNAVGELGGWWIPFGYCNHSVCDHPRVVFLRK